MDQASFRKRKLLACRIPLGDVILGRAYVIHARNGGVGVAVMQNEVLGYRLRREKSDDHYLFIEYDWANGAPHGTAIPLRLLEALPPEVDEGLLEWLAEREKECEAEVMRAWEDARR